MKLLAYHILGLKKGILGNDFNNCNHSDWTSTTEVKIALSRIEDIEKDATQQQEVDKLMDEAEQQAEEETERLMNQCNAPFICSSACPENLDLGQKDCPSGYVCCMG